MKIYQVLFDCITITAIAEDEDDLLDLLQDDDTNFFKKDDVVYYDFGAASVNVDITEIPFKRSIIHTESH